MKPFRKSIFAVAGYNTTYMGTGRPEFDPRKPMRPYEEYLQETARGTLLQVSGDAIDQGIIGSFMPARFLHQANIPGFLPWMVPSLKGKPCTGVEGACGTGGRALAMGIQGVLSDLADAVFVVGFEMQNTLKAVYGADVLAGAGHYSKERKGGEAHFFPGIFAKRAGAYYERHGYERTREAMAKWYEQMILNARNNPKAQEFHNQAKNLMALGLMPPCAERFVPHLNLTDCSKVSDGASSLIIASEEGLEKLGVTKREAIEIVGMGGAESDITKAPEDLTVLSNTRIAVEKAIGQAGIALGELAILELHDCFTITSILALEAIGLAKDGRQWILDGHHKPLGKLPTNLSGGLGGFGHPTGATGVRQMVDLLHQFTGKASYQITPKTPYGLMISMGGNDITTTAFITKSP